MAGSPEPGPLFGAFPPRASIAPVVTRGKRVRARVIGGAFPPGTRRRWGGAGWEEGYVARPGGDKVTAAVIRRDLPPHRLEKTGDAQLHLCASS
jgi:REP element-mobilizing transposase RayT